MTIMIIAREGVNYTIRFIEGKDRVGHHNNLKTWQTKGSLSVLYQNLQSHKFWHVTLSSLGR